MKMKKQFKKMCNAYEKYESERGSLEAVLFDKINFKFSIVHFPGDGFVILDIHSDSNGHAPHVCCLDAAIKIIESSGCLNSNDVKSNSF